MFTVYVCMIKKIFPYYVELMNADLIKQLLTSESKRIYFWLHVIFAVYLCSSCVYFFFSVLSPLLRLSPAPSEQDYACNLDESEGLCDLFDIPVLNVWPWTPVSTLLK